MEQGSTGLGEGATRARKGPSSPIYSVELEVFEGPLDLLLHLVRKHELDILDIPIAFVAEKYLEYLEVMRQLDLEIAGDYLVMAATLAYLKSRELLPPEPRAGEAGESEEEAGEDPREALIRRLVEYERFKQAAAELDSLPVSGRDVFARGAELVMPPVDPGLAPVSLFNLAEAYYRVLTRAKVKSTHEVTIEPITVAQRIKQLALMLDEKPHFEFEELFLGRTWNSERELRQMLVVTLMSILEMVKLGVAGVQQPHESPTIRIYRRASAEQTQQALADYDEDASFGAPQAKAPEAEQPEAAPPAPEPRVSEAELDAVEEAALLAEALAAVQEPEEPVLGYADETEDLAANDPSGEYEEDEPRASRGGRGGAPSGEQARRGEPVREDIWDGGREPRDGEVSGDAAPVRGEGREEDGGAGGPGGGHKRVDVLSGRSSEDGAHEASEPHGLDDRDAAVLAAQGEGVREDRSSGEAPVAGEAGVRAAAQGEDVREDISAGEGEASVWGAAPGEDVRERRSAGEASEATGEAGLDGRDDVEVVSPVESVGEDARSELCELQVVDEEVARVDEDLEVNSREHDKSVETVASDESEAAVDAADEQGAASSAADAGSTPGAGSATYEPAILDERVARERGGAEALREDGPEDRSVRGSEETGDGGESVGAVNEGSGAVAHEGTLVERVERAGEDSGSGLVAYEPHARPVSVAGAHDEAAPADQTPGARAVTSAGSITAIVEAHGQEEESGHEGEEALLDVDRPVAAAPGVAARLDGDSPAVASLRIEGGETDGELDAPIAAEPGLAGDSEWSGGEVSAAAEPGLESGEARRGDEVSVGAGPGLEGYAAWSREEVSAAEEPGREGDAKGRGEEAPAVVELGSESGEAWRGEEVSVAAGPGDVAWRGEEVPAVAEQECAGEAAGRGEEVLVAVDRGIEGDAAGRGEEVLVATEPQFESGEAWSADEASAAEESNFKGDTAEHGEEVSAPAEPGLAGDEARRGEDVPAITESATTNEFEVEEARASERSEVTARPVHDDVHEGDEPVRSDSDEEVAGGLFLNTGEGLGTRELVEVDDEDDAQ